MVAILLKLDPEADQVSEALANFRTGSTKFSDFLLSDAGRELFNSEPVKDRQRKQQPTTKSRAPKIVAPESRLRQKHPEAPSQSTANKSLSHSIHAARKVSLTNPANVPTEETLVSNSHSGRSCDYGTLRLDGISDVYYENAHEWDKNPSALFNYFGGRDAADKHVDDQSMKGHCHRFISLLTKSDHCSIHMHFFSVVVAGLYNGQMMGPDWTTEDRTSLQKLKSLGTNWFKVFGKERLENEPLYGLLFAILEERIKVEVRYRDKKKFESRTVDLRDGYIRESARDLQLHRRAVKLIQAGRQIFQMQSIQLEVARPLNKRRGVPDERNDLNKRKKPTGQDRQCATLVSAESSLVDPSDGTRNEYGATLLQPDWRGSNPDPITCAVTNEEGLLPVNSIGDQALYRRGNLDCYQFSSFPEEATAQYVQGLGTSYLLQVPDASTLGIDWKNYSFASF